MSDVLEFNPKARKAREPSLTDAELVEVRKMLTDFRALQRDFDKIGNNCPIARRELFGR